ncbi:DNA polymerase thumb domain-containing protein [Streptomyces sp. NPDC088789]|uniref:helix-hairpin-helix domain-containing protein n=1 Tax=Streptomyces sp. NPDC088789 TaxID=3365899 RepID=UPI003827D05B
MNSNRTLAAPHRRKQDTEGLAQLVRLRLAAHLGLRATIGAGPNPMIAAMAAAPTAPGQITVIAPEPEAVTAFLHPLPMAALYGVGPATANTLAEYGLHRIGDLASVPLGTLQRVLGKATALALSQRARGHDPRSVTPAAAPKTTGYSHDFAHDELDPAAHRGALLGLARTRHGRVRDASAQPEHIPAHFVVGKERFVNERRTSLPDIDLDVESERRLEVYDAIIKRFGTERTAVTGMPETYRARHALRDAGLALGIPPQVVGEIAKSFPHIRARDIRAALAELPELRQLASQAEKFGPLWELAEGLDALPRGYAMHPCGVILSDASLLDRLPVQPTPAGYPMVQADKEDIELGGYALLKLDVLGIRMQSSMAHAVAEIHRVTGRVLDLDNPDHVDLEDRLAFEMLQASDSIGLYQLESPGQQDLLSRLQPRHMQDVIADISLFRPGPVAGQMPARFIAARHGATPRYAHPDLEPILSDTYGVTIWHEQIIATFAQLTGCDRAAGEYARRALADADRLPRVEEWFRRTAGDRGYSTAVLDEVWETIASHGAYGFCRAHAVAFAVPALQSAFLKAHFPAFLYAGILEHDPGMWPRRLIVSDARRHGVPILPVDVNHSRAAHQVEQTSQGWGVRLAFSNIKGISEGEVARLVAGQPYTGLQDLWQRARPSLPIAQRLIRIGALGPLAGDLTRRDLLLQATELHRQSRARTATDGQLPLGGELVTSTPSGLPEMTSRDKLGAELDTLQIDVTHHLMEHSHRLLNELGATTAADLRGMIPGQKVLVAGVRASTQTPPIASGKRIIFVTLEDGTGLVDLAFFENSHEACAHTVFHSGLLLVRGTVESRGARRTVVGEMAWDLDEVAAARRDHGPQAALDLLGRTDPAPTPAQPVAPQRTLADGTAGARLHPYADIQPAGTRSADLRRLGHRSQGSAG